MKQDIKIEVQEHSLLLILPWKMSDWATPYQEAGVFGGVLRAAAGDVPLPPLVVDPIAEANDLKKIRYKTDEQKKLLILLFEHTDRIELIPSAASIIGSRILQHVQDLIYLQKGVRMRYDVPGREGRVTPEWSFHRRVFGNR